tara:strand:- start:22484 stop:22945 length:462 start_codon:yes stop_codon:yes gene_type:complete
MLPTRHLFFGTLVAIVLLFFPQISIIEAIIFVASTVLIDFDHLVYYAIVKKSINPFKAYRWYRINHSYWLKLSRKAKNRHKGVFLAFHGLEVFAIVLALGIWVHVFFIYVFMGLVFHLFLDVIEMRQHQDRLDKISIIHDYLKFRKLERQYHF